MNSENLVSTLIIGLVVAFGVGYLVGSSGREVRVESPFPANYDAIAVAEKGKASEASMKACFALLADHVTAMRQEVGAIKASCERVAH